MQRRGGARCPGGGCPTPAPFRLARSVSSVPLASTSGGSAASQHHPRRERSAASLHPHRLFGKRGGRGGAQASACGGGGGSGLPPRKRLGGSGDDDSFNDNNNNGGLGSFPSHLTLAAVAFSGAFALAEAALASDVPESADLVVWMKQMIGGRLERMGASIQGDKGGMALVAAEPVNPGMNLLVGKGSTVAGVAFAWKTLLCWCTDDIELASAATDLGFLSFLGTFSLFAIQDQYKNTRTFLLQAALSHIFLETVFEYGLVPRAFEEKAKPRMTWDMLVHHIGSLAIGIYCTRVGGGRFSSGGFLKQGARLACTEITTGLPVAFKAAIKKRRFRGKRRVFFASLMPVAFIWRSLYTLDVLRSFLKEVEKCGGRKAVPSKWTGAACFGSIVGCNLFWTYKIFGGVFKTINKTIAKMNSDKDLKSKNGDDSATGDAPAKKDGAKK